MQGIGLILRRNQRGFCQIGVISGVGGNPESFFEIEIWFDRTFPEADSREHDRTGELMSPKATMNSHELNPNAETDTFIEEPPRKSPWSMRAKVLRLCWGVLGVTLWKWTPVGMWGFRRSVLRLFGARIGKGVRLHPSVKVIIPWNIDIADGVIVHQSAILYALGPIRIGKDSEIGPHAHICAGTHDFSDPAFTLLRQPITIGERCLIGIGSFIAPDTVIADGTILEPRCAMYTNTEAGGVYIGNPGKRIVPASDSGHVASGAVSA
ncbi:MAG: hypothetical protein JJ916_07745 [Phycisphaerales bacterium]|nr:hypothetical protein [Phycisphaerales bacterium]